MNDHNLDDLIIDNIKPKSTKTKNMLTIVALLIVLLIVAIILTSVVLDKPKENPAILETNDTEMVSPELTLQNVTQSKKEKSEPKLNEIIEEELNKSVAAPKSVETVKEPESVKPVPAAHPTHPVKAVAPVNEVKTVVPAEAVKKVEAPVEVTDSKSVKITKEFEQTPVNEESSIVSKKVPEAESTAPATEKAAPSVKKAPVHKAPATSAVTYYIQVGSYKGVPSKRFLSVIKNNGFHYKITSPAANSMKKLLIGPYTSRKSVDTALIRVRDLINKSAFVVKK